LIFVYLAVYALNISCPLSRCTGFSPRLLAPQGIYKDASPVAV
jgi:hypothetical protein